MNFAIVGCGLIGHKRAHTLGVEHRVVACADTDAGRVEALARTLPDCESNTDPSVVINHASVEAVLVCTSNNSLAPLGLQALRAGKHVLIEKPGARSASELQPLVDELVHRPGLVAKVGYNHRFHPSFQRAWQIVQDDGVGDLKYVRARYGHGGRLGYEREWRADPAVSGGGELLDQGCHLIDLTRWFLGDCQLRHSHLATYFWPMPVEDNAFLMLETPRGQVASLHASWTEWKNLFSFEIFGRTGKLQIDGLGGSYGTERLTYYRMLPEMGPPETTIWEFPGVDRSWDIEMQDFVDSIETGRQPNGSLADGLAALEIIADAYAQVSLR